VTSEETDSGMDWTPEPCTRCVVNRVVNMYELSEKVCLRSWACIFIVVTHFFSVNIARSLYECVHTCKVHNNFARWVGALLFTTRCARSCLFYNLPKTSLGDIVNAIGHFDEFNYPTSSEDDSLTSITITMEANAIITHPDILITPTALASAPHCRRKPLMTALLRSSPSSPNTPSLLYGNILHEVIQECLKQDRWDSDFIEREIDTRLENDLGELLRVNLKVEEAKQAILERGKGVGIFGERYIGASPKVLAFAS
jgi:hypothetical protein